MKDDYLWDKTGEPDPEIEHLERVLGQLRHQGKPEDVLDKHEKLGRPSPRMFHKALALAAALAFVTLALGAWLALRQSKSEAMNSARVASVELQPATPQDKQEVSTVDSTSAKDRASQSVKEAQDKPVVPVRRRSVNRLRETLLSEREQARGELAKEQLIKALQITSSKLDFVQKKVQGDKTARPST